jgi:putative component of membrane protein insertase Oxa1/YidC/SpoIIIJ protein YidD
MQTGKRHAMLNYLAIGAITLYQRYLSPRKGFSCAYRRHTGAMGCSGFGKHAIGKHGLFLGLVLLRRRLARCAWQAHQHAAPAAGAEPARPQALGRFRHQGGFADCGACDVPGCDVPDCDLPSRGCGGEGRVGAVVRSCGHGWEWFDMCSSCVPDWGGCGGGREREQQRLSRVRQRRDSRAEDKARRRDQGRRSGA